SATCGGFRIGDDSDRTADQSGISSKPTRPRGDRLAGMADLRITAGPFRFLAQLEPAAAPRSCERFAQLLPYRERLIHVRWSGEGCWIPLGAFDFGLGYENATSYPAPGHLLLHPGGVSETEILLAYGAVRFASKVGQLAG